MAKLTPLEKGDACVRERLMIMIGFGELNYTSLGRGSVSHKITQTGTPTSELRSVGDIFNFEMV